MKKNPVIRNLVKKCIKKLFYFIILLTLDSEKIAMIITALAERQPNGRSDTQPYDDAKKFAKFLDLKRL